MLSKVQSSQHWLSQFLPEHRSIAAKLLDSLHIVSSEDMRSDLRVLIEDIARDRSQKSALLPIRECTGQESIYDTQNPTVSPVLQSATESLGSEAFISNLYTEFTRARKRQFMLEKVQVNGEDKELAPSLSFMKQHKFKNLFLVDDLIGSGDRVVSYIDALFRNKTINSWVSYGYIKVHIVSFMATDEGKRIVSRAIKRRKNVFLHVMHRAPSIGDLSDSKALVSLCKSYADKNTQYPLGYKESAVRVVFTHSAPNNLPSILYRPVYKKFRPNNAPSLHLSQWAAMFPNRTIPEQFKQDLVAIKRKPSSRVDILHLLECLQNGADKREDVAHLMNRTSAYIQILLDLCERMGFLTQNRAVISITNQGLCELSRPAGKNYTIEKNEEFYYPH
ncbi:conserved hypothetical protein [Vibrio crassostreae]|nr:conserved hypothetical protein [Vibrio crassostreae]CAK2598618.1 conserved hypothetical protein [Vibrio crassostreae]CAK2613451.1 conserved hypothetical protein [Vibrio crassostreae]CAK2621607.1 conserved hypothetical protein [Vibrio crassostreae]CAK2649963.1 conserved hypothetical protein [Vibrio crassostreae]